MRSVAFALAAVSLAGCSILQNEVERGYERSGPAIFTTADVRIITQRQHPIFHNEVVCTEPSPDVAKALSTAAALSGQGGNGTITAGLALGGSSAEAAAELAGRSTALLGLRDGLFQACQAYANGAIGADAYALVLSRYGQLMTTLFLGQDITGAAGVAAKAALVQSPPANININAPTKDAPAVVASGGASGGSAAGEGAVAKLADTAPLALARMNEDYMNLDLDLAHLLTVGCINNADLTRLHGPLKSGQPNEPGIVSASYNQWLETICPKLGFEAYAAFAEQAKDLLRANVIAAPVNPVPGAPPAPKAETKGPTEKQIRAAQIALPSVAGCRRCNPGIVDGKIGPATTAAIMAYQSFVHSKGGALQVTGDLDRATLDSLGIP